MGILDEYRAQLLKDKENESYDFPEDSNLTESEREEYVQKLNELRNDPNDMENAYHKRMAEMKKMTEAELREQNLLSEKTPDEIKTYHAYCECGEELVSNLPPMLNPFTMEKICKHTCEKCGKIYNLEFAYPRLVIKYNGIEVPVYTR